MVRSKIVDETEAQRWFEDGKTYAWMVEEYRRKYNIETSISLWNNLRRRRGWGRRTVDAVDTVPWSIADEHRSAYELMLLRAEARRRGGFEVKPDDLRRLNSWKERMEEQGVVVHYDPDTERGFYYVRARPGIDVDLVRVPDNPRTSATE